MQSTRLVASLLIMGVVATSLPAFGRQVENWSYERLLKESDLVVIATPVKSVESADRMKLGWDAEFVGFNTTFNVACILKGKANPQKLTVLHYNTKALLNDGPMLVTFRRKTLVYDIEAVNDVKTKRRLAIGGPAKYILFLKRQKDGRFIPTSGQVDAALSVKELREPIPEDSQQFPAGNVLKAAPNK